MKSIVLSLFLIALSWGTAHAQAVIIPAPVPVLVPNCTLQRNAANTGWGCNTTVGVSQPLTDALGLIADDLDATKVLRFELSGFTTGTPRTWTIPNTDIVIPATIASLGANTFTGLQTASAGLASTTGDFSGAVTIGGALTVNAATGNVTWGEYTPIITYGVNAASAVVYPCTYTRVGASVSVACVMTLTKTAGDTQTTIGISLPVASAFVAQYDLNGTINESTTVAGTGTGFGIIIADVTNDRATLTYRATEGADEVVVMFQYLIR
jgi:hypothetical protein